MIVRNSNPARAVTGVKFELRHESFVPDATVIRWRPMEKSIIPQLPNQDRDAFDTAELIDAFALINQTPSTNINNTQEKGQHLLMISCWSLVI
ncbi:MAG: hypothetical protein COA73_06615 [Candidatus Hydrogenedentota bacterium]|nr:MAG: hypothetical protein COA73_06615 [Candidatus Hydrogenedentota bacterium]